MTALKKEINLLPKEPWETGILGQLIPWTLSVGRYVVVLTELMVISAFLYKFSLDGKQFDLQEKIRQKQAIINSYEDLEANFRQVQLQINSVKEVENKAMKAGEVLDALGQMTPIDAAYESITIDNDGVSLQGTVLSEIGLATLLTQTQASQNFDRVSLENVSSGTDNSQAIIFRMSLDFKQK